MERSRLIGIVGGDYGSLPLRSHMKGGNALPFDGPVKQHQLRHL